MNSLRSFVLTYISLVFFYLNNNIGRVDAHKSNIPAACPIYLTLSILSKNSEESKIEINWGPDCLNPPTWIGFYRKDPSIHDDLPEFSIETHGKSSGFIQTDLKLGKIQLPAPWNRSDYNNKLESTGGTKCLAFYITGYIGKEIVSFNCLKIQPNWMSDPKMQLSNVPLKNIFIPGTHCSGCYYNKSKNSLVRKYGFAQDFDVWTQLVMGVRYLDISVGFMDEKHQRNESRHYWIVNDSIYVTPLVDILQDIRQFVLMSNDIVIIDIHDFPIGFYNHIDRHQNLIQLLEMEFGDLAFRRTERNQTTLENCYDLTLNQMIREGKQLLIKYNDKRILEESNLVWASWKRYSINNVQKVDIKEYMRKVFTRKYDNSPNETFGWSFFGTQSVESSFPNGSKLPTTRERAESINRNVSIWLGGPWSQTANVVAMDFVFSTNLIDIAIHTNSYKTFDANNNFINFDMQDI